MWQQPVCSAWGTLASMRLAESGGDDFLRADCAEGGRVGFNDIVIDIRSTAFSLVRTSSCMLVKGGQVLAGTSVWRNFCDDVQDHIFLLNMLNHNVSSINLAIDDN